MMGPGQQQQQTGRPGQMTAVMRAMSQATGPKVLRIGLVNQGRIIEERIIKQRTSVTIGQSEKAMFVVPAPNVPPQFKLFELVGSEYYLNFLDGMSGRVALQTGITDISALKGQARRVGPAYQVKLTEDARGKVVVGETTFLFQFVAPPPVQPRPQLPLAVKAGIAAAIDWNLTIIVAFSFLVHFGAVGALYSDWMDPVVNDDMVTAGIIDMVNKAAPPVEEKPPEAPTASATASADTKEPAKTAQQRAPNPGKAVPDKGGGGSSAPDPKVVAGLLNEAEQAKIAILAALGGGPATQGAMRDDHGAPVDLNQLAQKGGGMGTHNSSGLNVNQGGGSGPIQPGKSGGLENIRGNNTGPVATSAGTANKVVITGNVSAGGVSASVPVSNAEAVIRGQIAGAARACYNKGLQVDPNQQGRVVIVIRVGPSGEVESASVGSNSGLSPSVASCIASAARRAKFESPGPSGSTLSAPFNFVKQGG